jgi:hypothetical protein
MLVELPLRSWVSRALSTARDADLADQSWPINFNGSYAVPSAA